MQRDERYSIDELAALTGTTARLVRHYVQERLLPKAENPGRGAFYGRRHLDALKAIQILKFEQRGKLHEIAPILADPERVRMLAQRFDEVHTPRSRSLPADLAGFAEAARQHLRQQGESAENRNEPEVWASLPRQIGRFSGLRPSGEPRRLESARPAESSPEKRETYMSPAMRLELPLQAPREVETWNRVSLSDGIELHVRTSSGFSQEAIDRAIEAFWDELLREF